MKKATLYDCARMCKTITECEGCPCSDCCKDYWLAEVDENE
nr:MAG TPA: transposase [Caudoviricetes sp.]